MLTTASTVRRTSAAWDINGAKDAPSECPPYRHALTRIVTETGRASATCSSPSATWWSACSLPNRSWARASSSSLSSSSRCSTSSNKEKRPGNRRSQRVKTVPGRSTWTSCRGRLGGPVSWSRPNGPHGLPSAGRGSPPRWRLSAVCRDSLPRPLRGELPAHRPQRVKVVQGGMVTGWGHARLTLTRCGTLAGLAREAADSSIFCLVMLWYDTSSIC